MRIVKYIAIVLALINFVDALPYPQFDDGGRELLSAKDTINRGFPWFWYARPFYDDNDDGIANEGQIVDRKRRSSTISYVNIGSGWGR